jgi:DivIVA domain-containing protein
VAEGEAEQQLATGVEQIRRREFATVRRGYDPDQVRSYLAAIAGHVEGLERALAEERSLVARLEVTHQSPGTDAYERLSERFAGVLASADAEAEEMVEQARAEAARIKAEAQASAEDLRIRSSRSLIEAQEESDRMLEDLASRREDMLRQLHDMQSRLLSVADDLELAIQPSEPAPPSPPEARIGPGDAAGPGAEAAATPEPDAAPEPEPTVRAEAQPPTDVGSRRPPVTAPQAPPGRGARSATSASDREERPEPELVDVGLAALFDEPVADDVDLPDLSGIDLDLDLGDEASGR